MKFGIQEDQLMLLLHVDTTFSLFPVRQSKAMAE